MSLPRKLHIVTGAVLLLGLLFAGWAIGRVPAAPGAIALLLALGLPSAFGSRLESRSDKFRLTVLLPAACMAQVVFGTGGAMIVVGVGVLSDSLLNAAGKSEREIGAAPPVYATLFHLGNSWLAAGLAGLAASWITAVTTSWPVAASEALVVVIWNVLFAGLLTPGEALAHSAAHDYDLRDEWQRSVLRWGPNAAAGVIVSLISLYLFGTLGPLGATGFVIVLCVVHFANRFYLEKDLASRQFDSLLAGVRDGVAILQDYTIIYANEAFAQILRRPRETIVGTEYPRYLPPHAMGWTDLRALAQAGLAEMEMRLPDSSLVRVEVSISPVLYHARQCVQIVARDVTARYALQRQAAQTQKLQALGQMAAGVAHDFNNSLMAIVGNLSVARAIVTRAGDKHDGFETAATRLKMAEQAAMDAASSVRRLQIFSRPSPDTLETVDVADLLREVRLILRPLWQDPSRPSAKAITIEVVAPSPVPVQAASAELREAVTNLVTNAVHALPKGGIIRLGAVVEGGEAVVTVADSGTGMPPEVAEHAFEPFFTTKEKSGTGLGLFVTAGIVAHHRGRIRVESTLGKGTTFTMHFPLATEGEAERAAELPPVRAGLRALLVEDDPPVREAIVAMLNSAGVTIDSAGDGQAALDSLAQSSYDVVITDLSMPGMTGIELARAARARCPALPIVLVSGWLGKAQERSEIEADGLIAATLNKPLQLASMLEAINSAVGGARNA